MKEIELSSWAEFPPIVDGINADYGEHEIAGHRQRNLVLYRGQADYDWRLNSTLERFSSLTWSVESYAKGSRKNSFTLSMEKLSSSNLAVGYIASVRFAPFACQKSFCPSGTVSCLEMRGSSVLPKFW